MDEVLPNALMMGVDYEVFWTLNPKSLTPFIKAFSLKQKHEDKIAWQHGVYIRSAIGSCFDKNCKYPKEPFMARKTNEKGNVMMSESEIKARFLAHAHAINSTFSRKEGNLG